MEKGQIAELLRPFLGPGAPAAQAELSGEQLSSISTYIELLARWNARMNLTAVREAESIVTRHFGESLFLAAYLFPRCAGARGDRQQVLDLGSGAGFPGLPLKIYAPELHLTLVESNHKKAAFLSEVIRALDLKEAAVFAGRMEARELARAGLPGGIAPPDLVTMRAVERFEAAAETACALARRGAPGAKLALLLGASQAKRVPQLVPDFSWEEAVLVPQSRERVLLRGRRESNE